MPNEKTLVGDAHALLEVAQRTCVPSVAEATQWPQKLAFNPCRGDARDRGRICLAVAELLRYPEDPRLAVHSAIESLRAALKKPEEANVQAEQWIPDEVERVWNRSVGVFGRLRVEERPGYKAADETFHEGGWHASAIHEGKAIEKIGPFAKFGDAIDHAEHMAGLR